jgi:hypothetical protein
MSHDWSQFCLSRKWTLGHLTLPTVQAPKSSDVVVWLEAITLCCEPTVAHFAGGKYGHIVTAQVNLGLTDTSLEHNAFYCFNLTGADSVKPTWKKSPSVIKISILVLLERVCSYLWNYREILTTTIWRLNDNGCCHNFMRVTKKVSDHHLHHE